MKANNQLRAWLAAGAGVLAFGAFAWLAHFSATPVGGARAFAAADASASGEWSREVWACDRRKLVIVEGVRADERMPRERAQLVADVLQDLMRYCNEEITARLSVDQRITVTARGLVYEDYVPGGPLPIVPASFGQPTERERRIWKAALDQLVAEGHRLFRSDEIGTNGIACAMCHPHAEGTHPETYPKFQTQLKKVALLRDMVNWCILNPLEGEELAADDPRMLALEAYILSERSGTALEIGKH